MYIHYIFDYVWFYKYDQRNKQLIIKKTMSLNYLYKTIILPKDILLRS